MPKPRPIPHRLRGPQAARPLDSTAARSRQCKLFVEQLESRDLLTALPFGAMADDTGEYLLGDVRVTVVLMESDGTRDVQSENWTPSEISTVKANIQAGLDWWKDTLDAMPNVRDGLLNFSIDWTYADTPVNTGYEPIARISNDFSFWMYDFLNKVHFNATGNFSSDIRAFNNFQRQQVGADWGFTIFVVDNSADLLADPGDGSFRDGGSFKNAFAFAGGRFEVVPASRPASTYAHETGHIFWAFDEYTGSSASYLSRRGYYNTANTNHVSNPTPGFVQANSIMANDDPLSTPPRLTLTNAYNAHTSSVSSLETVGWKDSDGDGIFDVLDVPFTLTGTGSYTAGTGLYRFVGSTSVGTLPNQNTSGLQNDITINQIRVVEYKIDNGPWTTALTLPARTYQTSIDVSFPVPAGLHTVTLRTSDTRTGVTSAEFAGDTGAPSQMANPGISGFVFRDDDGDGVWDTGEPPLTDFGLEIVDQDDQLIDLMRNVEPSLYAESTPLNTVHPEAILSSVGADTSVDELQILTLTGTSGTVTPAFNGVNGTPLTVDPGNFLPTLAEVLASLNSIPALKDNVSVVGQAGGPFTVAFIQGLGKTNVSPITQGAQTGSAALQVTTQTNGVSPTVYAVSSLQYPSAGKVFMARSSTSGTMQDTWTSSTRQLRVDFPSKVSTVSIRAYSNSGGTSFGRLEAYNAQGVLIERFTSTAITGSNYVTMSISRPSADIAYIIARGHAGTAVVLDTLQWGPMTSATSNTLGAYSLASLPAGTYRVRANAPPNHTVTTPLNGVATITVSANQPAVTGVNFGIHVGTNIWHNLVRPSDVNNSGQSEPSPIDALMVINWINMHPSMPDLPETGSPEIDGYIDVNNDNRCTPLDALLIFNQLNSPSGGGGEGNGGGGGEGETPLFLWGGGDSSSEGETAAATPRNAAEYYAQNPIHFLEIAGADLPCGCEDCVAKSTAAAVARPVTLPTASAALPLLSQISTLDKIPALATTAPRTRVLPTTAAVVQRHVASILPTATQKVAATATAPKSKLDTALDAIAMDVSQAHTAPSAPHVARHLRARG